MPRLIIALVAIAWCGVADAQSPLPSAQIPQPVIEGGRLGKAYAPLIADLRKGGFALLFRHDRTDVIGNWDFLPFVPEQCDRQRNLSVAGVASARAIGEAIRALDVPVARVVTSTYCRAIDTGRLAFGGVHEKTPALIGPDGKGRRLSDVRREVDALIGAAMPGGNIVLVGHHGTTDAYTDRMLDEGDALVLKSVNGQVRVVAYMPAARWEEILRDQRRGAFEPK